MNQIPQSEVKIGDVVTTKFPRGGLYIKAPQDPQKVAWRIKNITVKDKKRHINKERVRFSSETSSFEYFPQRKNLIASPDILVRAAW